MAVNPFRCSPPRRADNKAPWRPRQSITLWSSLLEKRNPVLINGPTAAQPRRYHYIILLLFSLSLFLASCIGGNRARREEKKNPNIGEKVAAAGSNAAHVKKRRTLFFKLPPRGGINYFYIPRHRMQFYNAW